MADHVWLAALRRTAHACETDVSYNGQYTATQCLLDAGYDYIRVYDSRTKRLLADRTYSCEPSNVKLIVDDAMVFDGCAEDDSVINLPPSLVDRIRALLP